MGAWQPALSLLTRLWSRGLDVHLVHCVESVMPDRGFPAVGPNHPLRAIMAEKERQGQEALNEAALSLANAGVVATTRLTHGDPAPALMDHADKIGADLIVVRSSEKGFWGMTLFGSTAKGILMGAKQSVLVVKTNHAHDGKVNCVVATDHSTYMSQCLAFLEKNAPTGLGRLVVFTANEMDASIAEMLASDASLAEDQAQIWQQAKLIERSEEVARDLRAFATDTDVVVSDSDAYDGIRDTMIETQSELLIMGAQGHGIVDRLTLGSKSFHHVLSEPYSVFVLRVCPSASAV